MTVNQPARWLTLLAYAAIYIIWGSSYLGIHFAIQTIPPFLMTGARFLLGALILIGWAKLRGAPWLTRSQWKTAIISGFLLFVVNNGAIVWAEGHGIPSGVAAVLVATVPLWMVLLTWLRPGGTYPGGLVIAGLVIGFVGILLLASPGQTSLNMVGVGAVLLASLAWAYGSLYAKTAAQPESATLGTGAQLLAGGLVQLAISAATGEFARFDPAQVSTTSLVAMLYLAVVSSVIAYSAFVWLMRVSDPAKVSTYAYVNPVVAVFLGWLLASEPLTARTVGATAVIILAVVMINGYRGKGRKGVPRLRTAEIAEIAEIEAVEATP